MENASFFGSIVSFFTAGGFWMTPIFFAQVVSLAIIVERCHPSCMFSDSPNLSSTVHVFEPESKRGNLDRVSLHSRDNG